MPALLSRYARAFGVLIPVLAILALALMCAPEPRAQADVEPKLIRLQQATFDPLRGEPPLPASLKLDADATAAPTYYVLQFHGPIEAAWKEAVEKAGATLYGYIPDFAFVVRMDGATRQAVAGLPFVRWVGVYQPAYKLAPSLHALAADSALRRVNIVTFEPADATEVVKAIEGLGGQPLDWDAAAIGGLIRADMPTAALADLARLTHVRWIEPYAVPTLDNDAARGPAAMNVDAVQQTYGLTGEGQIIGQADTGLDIGDLTRLHPDLRDRVKAAYAWGRRTVTSFASPGAGPMGLTWDGGRFWVIDWVTGLLYKTDTSGTVLSSCRPSPSNRPAGLVWDGASLWYVERQNNTVYHLSQTCDVLGSFKGPGTYAVGLAWDDANLWVADTNTDRIYQVTTAGAVLKSFAAPGQASDLFPAALLWANGYLWVGDSNEDVIYKLDSEGHVLDQLAAPGYYVSGLAWDGASVWATDPGLDRVFKLSLDPAIGGDWSDPNGHGTHTAASIVGTGKAWPGSGSSSLGQYHGVAPGAELVHQSVMAADGTLTGIPLDLGQLLSQAYSQGARIHSDSWGADSKGAYTLDAAAADRFMWDHKDTLLVFSAGNAGQDRNADGVVDSDSLGAPATAKDVLAVGATENPRPAIPEPWRAFGFPANPIRDDKEGDNSAGLAAFSSRGPTDDGRIKPDLVAPGTWIASARTQQVPLKDDFESSAVHVQAASQADQGDCEIVPLSERDLTRRDEKPAPKLPLDSSLVACQHASAEGAKAAAGRPASVSGWTPADHWRLQTDTYHSPTHAWANTGYSASAWEWLKSGTIDARDGPDTIGFYTKYTLGSDDNLLLAFSVDGFYNWIGYVIRGSQADWKYRSFYIPFGACWWNGAYVTCLDDPSHFQFAFVVRSGNASGTGESVYVDDVRMYSNLWGRLSENGLAAEGSTADEMYALAGGTSMSAPLTAGAAALVRQYYMQREGITPSAALVKATLIDGATDLTPGQYGARVQGSPVFQDTMENGAGPWVAETPWSLTTSAYHSENRSWTDSPNGNYSSNTNASLTLNRSFDLSTISHPGLSLWQRYDIERGYDDGFAEISTNQGVSWTKLITYTGTITTWHQSVIDLSGFSAAHAARFRFRLQTDDSVNRDGWYIDDVAIGPVSFQEINARPDGNQGWGRVNLERSLFPTLPRRHLYSDDQQVNTGDTYQRIVEVTGETEPLRVTLVWTDYPSALEAAVRLVNDLDVKVIGPDASVYYPNGGTGSDTRNTVEGVEVKQPVLGRYTVEVRGHSVPYGPQPFALVISGAVSDHTLPDVTATLTETPTMTPTPTFTSTPTPTLTAIATQMPTTVSTGTPTVTPVVSSTPTATPTATTRPGLCSQPYCLAFPLIMKRGNENLTPGSPTLSFSQPTRDTIHLTWTPASRATAYRVWQLNAADGPQVLYSGTATDFTLTDRPVGAYVFSVDAMNIWGVTPSNSVTVVVQPPPTPTPLPAPSYPSQLPSVADSTIIATRPDMNFGPTADMWVGYDHCDFSSPTRSLMKFDTGAIPANAPIVKAELLLYLVSSCDLGNRAHVVHLYRASSDWTETGVTWNNQPGRAEEQAATSVMSRTFDWYSFDITGLVRGWANGSLSNQGIVLTANESSGNDSARLAFLTRDTVNADYRPYVRIQYAGVSVSAAPADKTPDAVGDNGQVATIVDLAGAGEAERTSPYAIATALDK